MPQAEQQFGYTADRRSFYGYAGGWLMLFTLEGGVLSVLILVLAPGVLLKVTLLVLLLGALLLVAYMQLLAPLWTRHGMSSDELVLRFGRTRLTVSRAAITGAVLHAASKGQGFLPGAEIDAQRKLLKLVFSGQGLVLLQLREPRCFPLRRADGTVEQILINVDRPADFLGALGVPPAPQVGVKERQEAAGNQPDVLRGQPLSAARVRPRRSGSGAPPLIEAVGLTRRYGEHVAVDNLDVAVQPGEIYGSLGLNGAGKTSTIKMLVGLLAPTSGRAIVGGHDLQSAPDAAEAVLGFVPDRAMLYERLTGREFLSFLARLRGLPLTDANHRIDELLALLDLDEDADVPCGKYSFGMKRKLGIAGALLHRPRALILDEPLNGLDPRSARRLKDTLSDLAADGAAIFLFTHDLAVAEAFCHRVGILHRGRLVAEGDADQLRALVAGPDLETVCLALTADQEVVA